MRYSGNGPQEEIYGGLTLSAFAALFRRSHPFPRDSRKLRGTEHQYRIRIGDYQVIYEVDLKSNILTVFHVRHIDQIDQTTSARG